MSKDNKLFELFIPIKVTSGSLQHNKKKFAMEFCSLCKDKPRRPFDKNLYLKIIFFFSKKNNCDIDNLLKNLFDALQKDGYLSNDKIIKKINVEIRDDDVIDGVNIAFNRYKGQYLDMLLI